MADERPLHERIRMLAAVEEAYLNAAEDDELILKTARGIDADMTYLGMDDAITEIAADVEKLQEALAFYAEEINWRSPGRDEVGWLPSEVEEDKGGRARVALGQAEREESF